MNSCLIITGTVPPLPPAQAAAGVVQGLGRMPPAARTAVPRVIFSENKKGPGAGSGAPPPKTHQISRLYIYLCAPGGGEGHLAASRRGAPSSPKPSCLFSHFINSDIALQAPTATATAAAAAATPPCSPGGWLGHPSVHGAPSPRPHPPSVVVRLLLLGLTKPLEESCDRFKGHTLALLFSGVLATLPTIEGVLLHHVLIVQRIKEHPKQVCKQAGQQLQARCPQPLHPPSQGSLP